MTNQIRLRRALHDARRVATAAFRAPDKFPADCIMIPMTQFGNGRRDSLTNRRLRVLDLVRTQGPFSSLDSLAEALSRPKARVSQDVQVLEAYELVHSVRRGRTKRIEADWRPVVLA